MASEFTKRIYEVVRQIPRGCVASYGQVAFLAGNPRARGASASRCTAAPSRAASRATAWYLKTAAVRRPCLWRRGHTARTAGGRRRGFPAGRPRRHGPLRLAEIKFFRRSPPRDSGQHRMSGTGARIPLSWNHAERDGAMNWITGIQRRWTTWKPI